MTAEQRDQIIRKIDEVIGPPESESPEDRRRRLRATARQKRLRRTAAARPPSTDELSDVDTQRGALLRRLRDAERAEMAEPDGSDAALLVEGIVLRLEADLRWLETCEQSWTDRRSRS